MSIVGFSIPLLHLVKCCQRCKIESVRFVSLLHTLSSEKFCLQQAKLIHDISFRMLQQPIHVKIMGALTINYGLLTEVILVCPLSHTYSKLMHTHFQLITVIIIK